MKTPQPSYPKLAAAIGVPEIYLKREDRHKYGSHKGRSIPLMIKTYFKEGARNLVISSSGNAALAAMKTVIEHNKNNSGKEIKLKIFLGNNINLEKLNQLKLQITDHESQITIVQTEKPKQAAGQLANQGGTKLLRQSTDDLALTGYFELARELNKIPNLQAIFIPTSSGTTAQALGEAFAQLGQNPQIHIVQTTACHPIALAFRPTSSCQAGSNGWVENAQNQPLAGAIVDKIAHRKNIVVALVKQSGGDGWIVNDNEIKDAITLVKQTTGLTISPNSALSVAGLKQAVQNNLKLDGPVVCLVTGP